MPNSLRYDHIVLVSIDTLRTDAIAANPFKLWQRRFPDLASPRTDVLDDLVGRGAWFPNVISAAPYTAAAHGAIFTGRFPPHNGVHEFYNGKLRGPSIFSLAQQAGLRTIMKVDFPVILGPELGFTADVDVYLDEDDDAFIDAIGHSPGSVALAHFGGVHIPYGFHNLRYGGRDYRAKVAELEAALPEGLPFLDRLMESHRDREDTDLLLRYKRAVGYLHSAGAYEALMRLYLEGVEHFLTTRLERFLGKLAERVRASRTRMLLVLFADHGEEFDEHTHGHFDSVAEAVLRVPLVLVGEGIAPGRYPERIRTVDILPTVLALTGLTPPDNTQFDGRSLAERIHGGAVEPDAVAFAEAYASELSDFNEFQERQRRGEPLPPLRHRLAGQAVYSGSHRLVRVLRRPPEARANADALESVWVERFDDNLVPSLDADADQRPLRALLDAYHQTPSTPQPVPATADIRAQLRSLGYTI